MSTTEQAVTVAQDITRNPESIWLSPICGDTAHHGEGRTWAAPNPDETCEDCSEPWVKYVRVDLASVSSASAEGWKLVPVEMTDEMASAAAVELMAQSGGLGWEPTAIYRAMLAASPEPVPATNQAGEVDVTALQERIADLEGELEEALYQPWPKWVEDMKKQIRVVSGYDGYDDATDGVNLPDELSELINELTEQADKNVAEARAARKLDELESSVEHYRNGMNEWIAKAQTLVATQPATSQEGEAIRLMKASDMPEFEACDVSYLESLACYLDNYARDKGKERLPATKNLFEDMAKRLREYDAIRIALAATPTPPTLSEDLREVAPKKFRGSTPIDLMVKVFKHHGWPVTLGRMAEKFNTLYEMTADAPNNRYEATPRAALARAQVKAS